MYAIMKEFFARHVEHKFIRGLHGSYSDKVEVMKAPKVSLIDVVLLDFVHKGPLDRLFVRNKDK